MSKTQDGSKMVIWGMVNFAAPIPLVFFTMFWSLSILAISGFDANSLPMGILVMLPMFALPVSSVWAFVLGLRRRKCCPMDAKLCMWCSVSGFLSFFAVMGILAFLGSIG